MKFKFLSLLLSVFLSVNLLAQDWKRAESSTAFTSLSEAARMSEQIVNAIGLKANFTIAEANVPNAMAVMYQGKRYVLYNPKFIETLTRATGTKWAAISVLAHEIGHHLYSPSINKGKTSLATELEADQFSGFVLQKMGASLHEAQVAMNVLGNKYASRTHPARDVRVNSIAEGWIKAGGVDEHNGNIAHRAEPTESYGSENNYPAQGSSILRADNIAAIIHFNAHPGTRYYVTTRMNVVSVNDNQLQIIGKIKKSGDLDFPYIIYDETGYRVYVGATGEIFNSSGRSLGKLKEASGYR